MDTSNQLPLTLCKAQLEFQARLVRLTQDAGRQWLGVSERLMEERIAQQDALVSELLKTEEWQSLANLPAESVMRQWEQRFGDASALTQTLVDARIGFANGLHEAMQRWQQETVHALTGSQFGLPQAEAAWTQFFKNPVPWQQAAVPMESKTSTRAKSSK